MLRVLVLAAGTLGFAHAAVAQIALPDSTPFQAPEIVDGPWATVRLHVGPNLNVMTDWRDGLTALQDLARDSDLPVAESSCICMSWGAAALAHVTPRFAVGGQFEMLRDTRSFTVEDDLRLLGERATFAFEHETVVRTAQAIAALYPREGSRTHIQIGAGLGTGHATLSTPGSGASGRVRGWLLSTSIGTEARFWYVDAGWRFHRMRATYTDVSDHRIDEARDVFDSEAEVHEFVQARHADLSGGWVRVGLVFHFGRR